MRKYPDELEPQPRDSIQLLDPDGTPSATISRVRSVLSYDHREDLWEVRDSLGQVRIITQGSSPREWLEVCWPVD